MTSYTITAVAIEHYADALVQIEHLLGTLTGEEAHRATHGELEAVVNAHWGNNQAYAARGISEIMPRP